MSKTSENNKRIVKNTLFLYIRMLLIMGVSLYTSRIVLEVLGIEDFGVYNVVGGIVVLFTFINNAMVTSTQRFLNYELGVGNQVTISRVFSASVTIHMCIALLTFILAETVGLWFLIHYIKYPEGREYAVVMTYQFSILATCISIIRAPYSAAIISHECMSFYAYISVIESVCRLLIVYLLALTTFDKLIFYSFLMFSVILVITFGYYLYCRCRFSVCRYTFFFEKGLYERLVSFSAWSLFGGAANMGASQGLNILLNLFYGVTVNAAMGIANQVSHAVYSFVSNFQMAFNPQIVKSYAAGEKQYFIDLVIRTSKYSFYLLFIISLPVFICCKECLGLWLVEVPPHSVQFCRMMILFLLLDALQGPLWVSVQATGNIRNYQLLMSVMILSNIPLSFIAINIWNFPEIVLIIKIMINVFVLLFRLFYLNSLYEFPIFRYLREVVLYALIVSVLSVPVPLFFSQFVNSFANLVVEIFISIVISSSLVFFVGISKKERTEVVCILKCKLKK
ncbi:MULTISPECIES: lipopolysaccharide biosynthesis protein [Parabacteroides]|jgi:O-antigen/teichoic acid export membrane protein|uniref:lipopolysaccharide biosynthesis protein n=1 Tax=Parabacteroides TaxID=375288 RepID=UPI001F4160F9|nr:MULTISPECIES: lipopolysaccharide biosynthesis protein [unclassified Parabacteroides]